MDSWIYLSVHIMVRDCHLGNLLMSKLLPAVDWDMDKKDLTWHEQVEWIYHDRYGKSFSGE